MLKSLIRETLEKIEQAVFPAFAGGGWLTRVYYALLVPRFGREQGAVIAGRRLHVRGSSSAIRSALRRGIHRLEKGLVMRPRAPIFAEDYIEQTVGMFSELATRTDSDTTELRWAQDVLTAYFAAVESSPVTDRAKQRFRATLDPNENGERSAPYARAEGVRSNVAFEDFMALCRQRRSVRWFLDKPVEREKVLRALEAATQAPTACNRQPYLFRYFEEPTHTANIASIAMGTAGYADQIPVLLVLLGDFSAFEHERDRHLPYIDGSLAAMQFMLALETLGLSSCAINWPDIEAREKRMADVLELPSHIRPLMLIAVGYADPKGGIPYSAKKSPNSLLITTNTYS